MLQGLHHLYANMVFDQTLSMTSTYILTTTIYQVQYCSGNRVVPSLASTYTHHHWIPMSVSNGDNDRAHRNASCRTSRKSLTDLNPTMILNSRYLGVTARWSKLLEDFNFINGLPLMTAISGWQQFLTMISAHLMSEGYINMQEPCFPIICTAGKGNRPQSKILERSQASWLAVERVVFHRPRLSPSHFGCKMQGLQRCRSTVSGWHLVDVF
ncbi:hypothetical protein K431DRAFT_111810 [Polychaeton citri CBS 116435]|uniref:Uncharacterized protein n=1 Tax=Polychaeton citri CBS 116435 TaxID=1314669 RepID=A0A9P4UNI8_9PEZI|nr:hypothetical protein K431DRAFT_111810 [Polychaeton citri CBS 116435]